MDKCKCDILNNTLSISNAIDVTEAELSEENTSTSMLNHHHISIFGFIICSLLCIFMSLFCALWIRHETYHKKLKRNTEQNKFTAPLLLTEPHETSTLYSPQSFHHNEFTATATIDSVDIPSSTSADTLRTRITNSILKIALTQSMPLNLSDDSDNNIENEESEEGKREYEESTNDTTQKLINMIDDYDNDNNNNNNNMDNGDDSDGDDVDLEYPQNDNDNDNDTEESDDLLFSSVDLKRNTLSGCTLSADQVNTNLKCEEFIVIDGDMDTI